MTRCVRPGDGLAAVGKGAAAVCLFLAWRQRTRSRGHCPNLSAGPEGPALDTLRRLRRQLAAGVSLGGGESFSTVPARRPDIRRSAWPTAGNAAFA